jgi:hypothetical protein
VALPVSTMLSLCSYLLITCNFSPSVIDFICFTAFIFAHDGHFYVTSDTELRRQNVIWDATQPATPEKLRRLTMPKWQCAHVTACQMIARARNNIYRSYKIALQWNRI